MSAEAVAGRPLVVLYDANLLYPFHLRNLFVQLGVHRVVTPRWTDAIHDEWIRSLVESGIATRERLLRTRDIMKRALPDADVRGYEHRIAGLTLPDPGDRHVLAAAIESGAGTILTFNRRDFPNKVLAPFGLTVQDPDAFICDLYAADPEAIVAVVDAARLNLSQTTPTPAEFLEALRRQRLTKLWPLLSRHYPAG
ncbi:MAG TPA: PIN domain-containing protein [Acetobacteraceae bacterium]|nr:PIN domain-containing protein [Acetobacteraceae bacterium]